MRTYGGRAQTSGCGSFLGKRLLHILSLTHHHYHSGDEDWAHILRLGAGSFFFRVCSHGYRSARVFRQKVTMQFGIATLNVDGRNGGPRSGMADFGLVISGLLLNGLPSTEPNRTGIALTVGMALLGMALGRIVSGIVDRGNQPLGPRSHI